MQRCILLYQQHLLYPNPSLDIMFAFVSISILLIGIYGQSNNPNSEQQDAFFQQCEAQVAQVLEQASHGIKCYTDDVSRVEHEIPTLSEVFSLDKCHEVYAANTIYLRGARNTARQYNFTRDHLLDKKLLYVLNTQQGGQDKYTEATSGRCELCTKGVWS